MTKFFLLPVLLGIYHFSSAQPCAKKYSFALNTEIKYSFIAQEQDQTDTFNPIPKFVAMVELTKTDIKKINKLKTSDWLYLLGCPETDFAANLLLYSYCKKDAYDLQGKAIENWRKEGKLFDMEYWKKFLWQNPKPGFILN